MARRIAWPTTSSSGLGGIREVRSLHAQAFQLIHAAVATWSLRQRLLLKVLGTFEARVICRTAAVDELRQGCEFPRYTGARDALSAIAVTQMLPDSPQDQAHAHAGGLRLAAKGARKR